MKKNNILKVLLVAVLCLAMLLPFMPSRAADSEVNNFDVGDDFKGLKLSVLGDSISTYGGFTNNSNHNPLYLSTTDATFATYYGNTTHGSYSQFEDVRLKDTWWMQSANALGMDVLVNNSWSGSYVRRDRASGNNNDDGTYKYPAAGYKDRCVNLHIGSQKPDIIAVFLGTNDVGATGGGGWGTKASVDTATERNNLYANKTIKKTSPNSVEAYYIMLSRMIETYPDAEIYCMLPVIPKLVDPAATVDRVAALDQYNEGVKYLVDYFAGNGKKVYLVDMPANCGLVDETDVKDYFYANELHPNRNGMDFISSCFLSEVLEHSTKDQGTAQTVNVTYRLENAFVRNGQAAYGVMGKPFSAYLGSYSQYGEVDLTVTMGGTDITADAVSGPSVYIENVTGDIVISANGKSRTYYWKAEHDAWTSVSGDGYTHNLTVKSNGTYTATATSEGYLGTFDKAKYTLNHPVTLKHDKPWSMEFKCSNAQSNLILLSKSDASNDTGNTYIHINNNHFFLGYCTGDGKYYNSGQSWVNIASALGTTADNVKAGTHIYRLVNTPNGSNNTVTLYVDGKLVGPMDTVKLVNSSTTGADSINISGMDFEFNYFGASYGETVDHFALTGCSYEYMKICEYGTVSQKTQFNNYRWSNVNDKFLSAATTDGFVRNDLVQTSGSIEDGYFSNATFVPDTAITLLHDKPWSVEWKSEGTWRDSSTGAMLFATANDNRSYHAAYLYRRSYNDLIGFGEYGQVETTTTHFNYGIRPAEYGIDTSIPHTYRLTNRIAEDGSNMVYLFIDDEEIGAMDNCFRGGTPLGTKSDWLNGKDFVFNYIGTTGFPIGACELEYLQVWEQGSFDHGLDTTRLKQLLDTQLTDKAIPGTNASYTDDSWEVYTNALTAAQTLLSSASKNTTQADLDAAAETVAAARWKLVSTANSAEDKIYHVELLTGDYSRLGQQTALRVVTATDVAQLAVDSQSLLTCSSQIQTLQIDGTATVVKVWLLTWQQEGATAMTIDYTLGAYTDPDCQPDTALNTPDDSVICSIQFK